MHRVSKNTPAPTTAYLNARRINEELRRQYAPKKSWWRRLLKQA